MGLKEIFVSHNTISLVLFACFAFGLPIWAMQANEYDGKNIHGCSGDCYARWKEETGGVVAIEQQRAVAKAAASPAELGKGAFIGCVACHGAGGEGGIGPRLAGQQATDIASKLLRYKGGETLGSQSALMWSQAAQLSDTDIDNLAAYVETL
jgi:cytochrome c553